MIDECYSVLTRIDLDKNLKDDTMLYVQINDITKEK